MQKFWYVVHPLDFIPVSNYMELDVVKEAFVRWEQFHVLKEQFSFWKYGFIKFRIFCKNSLIIPYSYLESITNNGSASYKY